MDAQNEAYIIARDNFWREQIRNPPYNWAGWSKVFWGTFAVALLIVLALAGAPWILVLLPVVFILAATWKILVWIFGMILL